MKWTAVSKLLLGLLLITVNATAQESLVKDLDGDHHADTVWVDAGRQIIMCRLSTQRFRKLESQSIETLTQQSGVKATKNGFAFFNDFMRAGYEAQFRYQPATQKMQLIGLSRYAFGGATHDDSGESSVNLLIGLYIGNWNYFDYEANDGEGDLIKIPTIQTKMVLRPTTLETFGEATYDAFADQCSRLYEQARNRMQQSRKRK